MKYMGSKRRFAKHIIPIVLNGHDRNNWYVEPFVGGANMIDKVNNMLAPKKLASDIHPELIAMYQALQNGWEPPKIVTEEMYEDIRDNKNKYPPEIVGYVGFSFGFSAQFFGTYARNVAGTKDDENMKKDNEKTQSRIRFESIQKQRKKLKNVKFIHSSYDDLDIPRSSTVYCDPPYKDSSEYKTEKFNHDKFYEWCFEQKEKNDCRIFVSEYNMPKDFKEIFSIETNTNFATAHSEHDKERYVRVEKLFTI